MVALAWVRRRALMGPGGRRGERIHEWVWVREGGIVLEDVRHDRLLFGTR